MTTEVLVYDQKGSAPKIMPAVQTHNQLLLTAKADFAKYMIQTGMALGLHEKKGENESMTLLSPEQVVTRACQLTELAYIAFEERGWIVKLPSMEDMRTEIIKQNESGNGVGFK